MRSFLPLLALAVGCQSVRMTDTTRLSLTAFGGEDHLATPYKLGAEFTVQAWADGVEPRGWTLSSSRTEVLTLAAGEFRESGGDDEGETNVIEFPAEARGVGTTTLVLRDDQGEERHRAEVEVRAPDSMEVRAEVDLMVDPDAGTVTDPNVLVGGEAAFRVDFFADGTPLSGAGGLTLTPVDDAVAISDASTWPTDSDYMVLTPNQAGPTSVAVASGGVDVGVFNLEAVDSTAVTGLAVDAESEAGAETGDLLHVTVAAADSTGARVYGASFAWDDEGTTIDGEGDQLSYRFDPDQERTIGITYGAVEERVTIHGEVDGVGSSSDTACAVANVGPIGAAIALALVGIGRRRVSVRGG